MQCLCNLKASLHDETLRKQQETRSRLRLQQLREEKKRSCSMCRAQIPETILDDCANRFSIKHHHLNYTDLDCLLK
jgi:hypothetical protein